MILLTGILGLLLNSCVTPVSMNTWKNPEYKSQVSKVVIMPVFGNVDNIKTFENTMVMCFNNYGLKGIGSLEFLDFNTTYPINVIKHRCDSLGADAILLFNYKGTEKSESYIPPTNYYMDGYGGYGGYWGGGYWGGYSGVMTTGGYWTSNTVVSLQAKLYVKDSKDAVWTADIEVTNAQELDKAANNIGIDIISSWQKAKILKSEQVK
jgi:hypothetical protein